MLILKTAGVYVNACDTTQHTSESINSVSWVYLHFTFIHTTFIIIIIISSHFNRL